MKKNLVSSIVGEIQKQIESGQYPPGTSLPPFRDLAHIHNVSHATIQQAIRELRKKNFVVSYQGRGTVVRGNSDEWDPVHFKKIYMPPGGGNRKQVGMFLSRIYRGISAYIMPEYLRGVMDELNNWNLNLNLFVLPENQSALEFCLSKFHEGRLSGVILMGIDDFDRIVLGIRKQHIPCVVLNSNLPLAKRKELTGIRWVVADEESGVQDALRFLHTLGHARIAYIGRTGSTRRFNAYAAFMRDNGLCMDSDNLVNVVEQVIQKKSFIKLKELFTSVRPTAVFCDSDAKALGVLDAARELGVAVPAQLSVVGFDDIPLAAQTRPALTTVYKPRYEMGREAAYLLASSIQDSRRTVPAERILRTYLVHRASCATVLKRMPGKKVAAAVV